MCFAPGVVFSSLLEGMSGKYLDSVNLSLNYKMRLHNRYLTSPDPSITTEGNQNNAPEESTTAVVESTPRVESNPPFFTSFHKMLNKIKRKYMIRVIPTW